MTEIPSSAAIIERLCDALTGWPIGHGKNTRTIGQLGAAGIAQTVMAILKLDERDREVAAQALENVADALLPEYNCELRPDGSEDREKSKWVGYCFETDTLLRGHASNLRKA